MDLYILRRINNVSIAGLKAVKRSLVVQFIYRIQIILERLYTVLLERYIVNAKLDSGR